MKTTSLYQVHQSLGAKIVEFAGYQMPIQYAGILEEHRCVRTAVGMFDVSHMGEFFVAGPDALRLVQTVTTNNAAKLTPGKVQYSAMCYPEGGIVDDLLVYRFADRFMLVVNASNMRKDFEWITAHAAGMNVDVRDRSDEYTLLAVQGPRSAETLQTLTHVPLNELPYYAFTEGKLAGTDMIISRTGYTGELGFELYFTAPAQKACDIWNAILGAGRPFGIQPIGLGARDTLRLEMGYCLYGNDIDKTTNPLEAGLGWITKFDKGPFIGSETLTRVRQEGLRRRLVGLLLDDERAFPRHGYEVTRNGAPIGQVTSGTVSPILHRGIGMGYVAAENATPGTQVGITIRNTPVPAKVVGFPFIPK
ncbi:MAG TPA: glycine cleavage system aminomethyltransferase GcvT [Bacteroidota bacterium]|nr:glycine cleavage system aminomethyltransferase GcvT [Bacteroidota bacterium]